MTTNSVSPPPVGAEAKPQSTAPVRRTARKKAPTGKIIFGVLVLIAIGVLLWYKIHNANNTTGPIITGTVTRGDLVETVDASGNVSAQTGAEINIGSQISGTVEHLYADIGTHVNAGELIAKLSVPDLDANVQQAEANLANNQSKALQDEEGVNQIHTQSVMGVSEAQSVIASDRAKVAAAQATLRQQMVTTPQDIAKAKANLAGAQAGLAAANANYDQTKAGADLNVNVAQQALRSMQATAKNSAANLTRQQALLSKGFVAQSVVDQAQSTSEVDQANVDTAQQNLTLEQQKVNDDLETFKDNVTQAQQTLSADQSGLTEAQAEQDMVAVDRQNVTDAQANLSHDEQALQIAMANMANDPIKAQAVQQDKDLAAAAQQQVSYNEVQAEKGEIRTPISGTVITLAIQQGETIAAGLSAPTLITVCDLDKLQVDAFPDETDISKIKIGQTAQIQVDAIPGHAIKGVVTKIDAGATIQQGVVTYDVTLAVKDKRHALRPSETADCKIEIGRINNALLVPAVALQVGTKQTTVEVVKTVNGKQQMTPVAVTTGGTDGVHTQILSGLTEGETIVLAGGPSQLKGSGRGGPSNPFGAQKSPSGGGGKGS